MQFFQKKYIKAPIALLVILSLLLQFMPAFKEAQADIWGDIKGLLKDIRDKIEAMVTKIPQVALFAEEGAEGVWAFFGSIKNPFDDFSFRRDEPFIFGFKPPKNITIIPRISIGPISFGPVTKSIGHIEIPPPPGFGPLDKERAAKLARPKTLPTCGQTMPTLKAKVESEFFAERCEEECKDVKKETENAKCQDKCQKRRSLDERRKVQEACAELRRIERMAAQEAFFAKQVYLKTDPLRECLFLRNCRTVCQFSFGTYSYNIDAKKILSLILPPAWLQLVLDILDVAVKVYKTVEVLKGVANLANAIFSFATTIGKTIHSFVNALKTLTGGAVHKWFDTDTWEEFPQHLIDYQVAKNAALGRLDVTHARLNEIIDAILVKAGISEENPEWQKVLQIFYDFTEKFRDFDSLDEGPDNIWTGGLEGGTIRREKLDFQEKRPTGGGGECSFFPLADLITTVDEVRNFLYFYYDNPDLLSSEKALRPQGAGPLRSNLTNILKAIDNLDDKNSTEIKDRILKLKELGRKPLPESKFGAMKSFLDKIYTWGEWRGREDFIDQALKILRGWGGAYSQDSITAILRNVDQIYNIECEFRFYFKPEEDEHNLTQGLNCRNLYYESGRFMHQLCTSQGLTCYFDRDEKHTNFKQLEWNLRDVLDGVVTFNKNSGKMESRGTKIREECGIGGLKNSSKLARDLIGTGECPNPPSYDKFMDPGTPLRDGFLDNLKCFKEAVGVPVEFYFDEWKAYFEILDTLSRTQDKIEVMKANLQEMGPLLDVPSGESEEGISFGDIFKSPYDYIDDLFEKVHRAIKEAGEVLWTMGWRITAEPHYNPVVTKCILLCAKGGASYEECEEGCRESCIAVCKPVCMAGCTPGCVEWCLNNPEADPLPTEADCQLECNITCDRGCGHQCESECGWTNQKYATYICNDEFNVCDDFDDINEYYLGNVYTSLEALSDIIEKGQGLDQDIDKTTLSFQDIFEAFSVPMPYWFLDFIALVYAAREANWAILDVDTAKREILAVQTTKKEYNHYTCTETLGFSEEAMKCEGGSECVEQYCDRPLTKPELIEALHGMFNNIFLIKDKIASSTDRIQRVQLLEPGLPEEPVNPFEEVDIDKVGRGTTRGAKQIAKKIKAMNWPAAFSGSMQGGPGIKQSVQALPGLQDSLARGAQRIEGLIADLDAELGVSIEETTLEDITAILSEQYEQDKRVLEGMFQYIKHGQDYGVIGIYIGGIGGGAPGTVAAITKEVYEHVIKVMDAFSIIIGIKDATYVYRATKGGGLQAGLKEVLDAWEALKKIPETLRKIWGSDDVKGDAEKADIPDDGGIISCKSAAAIGIDNTGGPEGGRICPRVDAYTRQINSQFSSIRQSLLNIELLRRVATAISLPTFTKKLSEKPQEIELWERKVTIKELAEIMYYELPTKETEEMTKIYERATQVANKARMLWGMSVAMEFANEKCTCGWSFCKLPVCLSGLPLTPQAITNPYCLLIYIFRIPLWRTALALETFLEQGFLTEEEEKAVTREDVDDF